MTTTTQTKAVNGVDVDALFETIEAVKATPAIAKFKFRLNNKWMDGGHNRSTINTYYGAGEEGSRTEPFVLDADEPPVLLGNDQGPNPVEYLLKGLAACVVTSMVYHAAARGIEIEEVELFVEGKIDLRGFLNIDDRVRNGYESIRMSFKVKADVSDEELEQLIEMGPRFSPVFDSVTKGVPVEVTGERM